ncbi:hypothetical protein AH67_07075 [Bifidobacterium pseudolongum PV8-2]|uniref:Uncharacterized protein n=1 Tax=Bifidobacterium pseudolongum PV8-2 TaxID=1447715 RepID=A0A0A7IAN0_9BIFI|nr:hypothetical protein AH67_07075 [Bifidobacterium pseudolongum PV8-2]
MDTNRERHSAIFRLSFIIVVSSACRFNHCRVALHSDNLPMPINACLFLSLCICLSQQLIGVFQRKHLQIIMFTATMIQNGFRLISFHKEAVFP